MSKVYEIGYLLVSSIPEEKVAETTSGLKDVLTKKGATVLAHEDPQLHTLAYTMVKKIGATNHRFNQAYFGWVKFELEAGDIEAVKKVFEEHPSMLRCLIITTVRENTYLGKKAPAVIRSEDVMVAPEAGAVSAEAVAEGSVAATKVSASVEEIDKSIDEMVK